MATAVARVKRIRISARKVRLVADLIRGKKVTEARDILYFTSKGSAPIVRKALDSAVANAEHSAAEKNERVDTDEMFVQIIRVDEAETLKRFRPRARGSASPIRKRSSHLELIISDNKEN
jgi:large subunit ribosomal protein L22